MLPSGFLHPSLSREWKQIPPAQATLVTQCRLLYNFSVGHRLTRGHRYRHAIKLGMRFLFESFRDPDHAGWFFSVDQGGRPLNLGKDAYGHAFCIFGLAHAGQVLQSRQAHEAALQTWEQVARHFIEPSGGIVPALHRNLQGPSDHRTQNPMMHLFEALLALLALFPRDESIARGAEGIARFVHRFLADPATGRLPEMYDTNWNELPRERGGRIDLGHAMEWAYLLSRGVELGLDEQWLKTAEVLLANGLQVGEDSLGGLHPNEAPEGGLLPGPKGWWQQCELLRALIHFAAVRGRDDLWPRIGTHLTFVQDSFIDQEFGGWYGKPGVGGQPPVNPSKGNTWKVDYHVVALCEEALRVL